MARFETDAEVLYVRRGRPPGPPPSPTLSPPAPAPAPQPPRQVAETRLLRLDAGEDGVEEEHGPPGPPRIPSELEELTRFIMLLGSSIQGPLGKKARAELVALGGALPASVEQARHWKAKMRQLRREVAAEVEAETETDETGVADDQQ